MEFTGVMECVLCDVVLGSLYYGKELCGVMGC